MKLNHFYLFSLAGLGLLVGLGLAACAVTPGELAGVAPPVATPAVTSPVAPATASPAEPETAAMAGAAAPEEAAAVPFTTIAHGALLGAVPASPLYTVLEPAEWDQLRSLLPASLFQAGVPAAGSETLIVVAVAGVKNSSGYELTIRRITRSGSLLTVVVEETGPEPEQIVEPAATVPYHIVAPDRGAPGDAPARVVFVDTAGNTVGPTIDSTINSD